ncbi:MAG TPA: serine hydrolase domain-containing protein [Terriglobales bacterium]|nr:serine hydrolase domain-containing protein [Terriglobales bacterium]
MYISFGRFRKLWMFRGAILLLASFGALGFAAPETRAQTVPASTREEIHEPFAAARANADKIGAELIARGIPGLAIAVTVDGKIVYAQGFGYADLEQRVPAWPSTKFRIGSISKPLTAAALMKLVEAGKLDLDAPIQKYVPSFPDKGVLITPRLVAGHLAGIRNYKGDEFFIQRHYSNVLDGLKIFENDPLIAPPGTQFSYSSYGFNLLSAAVESACGEPFLACMQDLVFTPLDLRDTTADQNRPIIDHRTRFYTREKDGTIENSPYVDNSYKWAGGGFLSTPEDVVRFGSALLQPGYLKSDSLKLLFTSQKTKAGKETGYGIGWFVHKSASGQPIFEHAGGSVGGSCQLIIYPESRIVVALLTNLGENLWKIEDVEAIAEPFAQK